MQIPEDDPQESDVPELVVRALNAANQRARAAGRTVVIVRDRELIRLYPDSTYEVLRTLPPRIKVAQRNKVRGA